MLRDLWVGLLHKGIMIVKLFDQFREKLDGLPSIFCTLWITTEEEALQSFVFSTKVGDLLERVLVGLLPFLHLFLHLSHAELHGVDGLLEVLNRLLVDGSSIAVEERDEGECSQDHNGQDLESR